MASARRIKEYLGHAEEEQYLVDFKECGFEEEGAANGGYMLRLWHVQ